MPKRRGSGLEGALRTLLVTAPRDWSNFGDSKLPTLKVVEMDGKKETLLLRPLGDANLWKVEKLGSEVVGYMAVYVDMMIASKPVTEAVISVFWKVTFALIPPPDYCGGWACFFCSLMMIGLVTALVADLAGLLGCVVGMGDAITAITLVALGTSLPDTFASKAAAQQDPYADASIGNITGSNSVNVFLGLGLPWSIGAIYWAVVGQTDAWREKYANEARIDFSSLEGGGGKFIVVGGDLGFSVGLFTGLAVLCIVTLIARRILYGGELGGPQIPKVITAVFLVILWIVYVTVSVRVPSDSLLGRAERWSR
ncbi:unnamed protein product [Cladocopium goreaui]|uniref:Sodium/calcium exchanger membrane region domain-containing protein n=1 Tax=Cladocopium goreaui TaxID=2562237 RepID=A0A9P1BM33_9DINO|nr:unnamed protein product [Cladocopium goreaui]